jgi:NAD(P)-dependent dehydrogenase (short-subunit alcohol dehydrogenase family)
MARVDDTEATAPPIGERVALVTGASSGLGAHFARTLASQGYGCLALAARRTDRLNGVAEDCMQRGAGRVIVLPMDVADDDSIAQAFAMLRKGAGRIDLLVNNAGVADTSAALDTSMASFDRTMDVNLRGVFSVAVEAARMMGSAGGDIVNVASILGLRVANNVAAYAISKAGVVQMTKALAIEWARYGIRVNALAPGYIETEINEEFFRTEAGQGMVKRIPMRRLGQLADLDAPFLLLALARSAYLTGSVIAVDGGHSVNAL